MHVLILDTRTDVFERLYSDILFSGHETVVAESADELERLLEIKHFDIIILGDPGAENTVNELLEIIDSNNPGCPYLVLRDQSESLLPTAMQKIDHTERIAKTLVIFNAYDFEKPGGMLQSYMWDRKNPAHRDDKYKGDVPNRFVGKSAHAQRLRKLIEIAAKEECETVLLYGPSGSGKEVIAREVHYNSVRIDKPFVAVSCPAIPDALFESEMFGHAKGSFTGAHQHRPGYFEMADGGTLFLDEVADLSAKAQAKLLRALESRQVRRVGGIIEKQVDVKIIAATNVSLEEQVETGRFRLDLYYRLNLFTVDIPPLEERKVDIIPLAQYFLKQIQKRRGGILQKIDKDAAAYLKQRRYPGNVRQLRNTIERAALVSSCEKITTEDFHEFQPSRSSCKKVHGKSGKGTGGKNSEQERQFILQGLEKAGWNRRLASEILGIPYSTLRYKMIKLGIS